MRDAHRHRHARCHRNIYPPSLRQLHPPLGHLRGKPGPYFVLYGGEATGAPAYDLRDRDPAATPHAPRAATGASPGLYSECGPHVDQYPRTRSQIITKLDPLEARMKHIIIRTRGITIFCINQRRGRASYKSSPAGFIICRGPAALHPWA